MPFFLKLTKRMAKVRHAHILTQSILALNQSPQTRNCVQETARSHAYARFLRARATYHFISRPRSQTHSLVVVAYGVFYLNM